MFDVVLGRSRPAQYGDRAARRRVAALVTLVVMTSAAQARGDTRWRVGIDLHGTDAAFAARRPLGLAGGLRHGATELSVVIDPMLPVLGWEMLDVTIGRWFARDRIELLAGWRQTSGRLGGGRRYDEALLLGSDAVAITWDHVRLSFGVEFETSLWRHGARIPDDTIHFIANAELATRMEILLHARFEFTGAM